MRRFCRTSRLTMLAAALVLTLVAVAPARAAPAARVTEEDLGAFDRQVLGWANECRSAVMEQMKILLSSGRLNMAKLFDTFYVPIANTDPQKYHTQYDKYLDQTIQEILDRYLRKDDRLKFVVAVDRNGYLPTHNAKYSLPLTGNGQIDVVQNRTKRIFNDRTGLAAARNKESFLLQRYSRDTGEQMTDLSVPIFVNDRHWGAIRIGYGQ